MTNSLYLCFINLNGCNINNVYTYEFLFTENISEAWGDKWNTIPAGICGEIPPYNSVIAKRIEARSKMVLDLAQKNTCFSMGDCIDGIIPLGWENINGYDSYPDKRCIFNFGDDIDSVMITIRDAETPFEII